jgi:hypothetical protein
MVRFSIFFSDFFFSSPDHILFSLSLHTHESSCICLLGLYMFICRTIQKLVSKNNVLSNGFRSRRFFDTGMLQMNNVECFLPNTLVNQLISKDWERLLTMIGLFILLVAVCTMSMTCPQCSFCPYVTSICTYVIIATHLGSQAICDIYLNCTVFTKLHNGCYIQLTGKVMSILNFLVYYMFLINNLHTFSHVY